MYVSDNCGGCLQVPTPVYWSPYLAPALTRRPSFHIADILPAPSALHKGTPDNSAAFLLSAGIPTEAAVYADRRLQQKVALHVTRQSDVKDANRTTNERISISKRDLYRSVHHRSRRQDQDRLGADGPCRLSSALGPLKALCVAGGREFPFSSAGQGRLPGGHATSPKELSFGINQILSDDFGRQDKENVKVRSDRPEPDIRTCECTAIDSSLFQPLYLPGHALSGVRTLQPPYYPDSPPGTDILPGPYSVMNSDVNVGSHQKRKRSWSRAVFSNLQRKGLEKRFDVQKYVTKPDRRQLAAMLGLTDAQVKVWFQNRRMKWRHTQQTTSENEKNSASDVDDTPVVTFQESEQDSALVKNEHAIELEVTDNAADVISDDNDMACNFTESHDNTSPENRDNS